MDAMEYTVWGIALPVLVLGIVQAIKMTGLVPKKFSGVLAIVIGAAIGTAGVAFADSDIVRGLVQGAAAGLFAVGLWSTAKNSAEGFNYVGRGTEQTDTSSRTDS